MESLDLASIEAVIARLSDGERAELEALTASELEKPFLPNPGPQQAALESEAEILLYGGAAGGGKTALEVGAYFLNHHSGIILRREATQLDGIIAFLKEIGEPKYGTYVGGSEMTFKRKDGGRLKLAGLNQPDDWRKHAGNARDYMAFDEAGEFLREQVFSLIGWLRSVRPNQRCRVILGSNPPRGGDGDWLIEEFAPWLDQMHPDPAEPGELRWAIVVGGVTEWVDEPGEYTRDGETYTAMSRTFIPAKLDDNPYLRDTNYRTILQGLPEPLRSQLLHGDFLAGRQDHEFQVIPTDWVKASMKRWREAPERNRRMLAISADIAQGGQDNVVIGALYDDHYFSELSVHKGVDIKDPIITANLIVTRRRDDADTSVDSTGGWGTGVASHLKNGQGIDCYEIVYSRGSGWFSRGKISARNVRAEMYWDLREGLDPNGLEENIPMLPDDPRLLAELTAIRWDPRARDIKIESKEEVKARTGGSPDRADTIVQLWHRRHAGKSRRLTRSVRTLINANKATMDSYNPLEGF